MINIRSLSCCILVSSTWLACSDDTSSSGSLPTQPSAAGQAAAAPGAPAPSKADPIVAGPAGLHEENGAQIFRTEPFTVPAGSERYVCWTVKTDKPLQVKAIEFAGSPGIHHLTFAQTIAPEPEGMSECEVLLKTTWMPLFSAGAGANKLSLPAGVAHVLPAGTQLLVQLHLLNATDKEVSKPMQLRLEVSNETNSMPVKIGGFGSFHISLPPHQKSTVSHECSLPGTSRVVAMMPHMHQLATSMTLELGTSASDLKPIYTRDPWNFDQQSIDNVDMMLKAGTYARVTCNYDNTTDKTVTYGESSYNEMCFLGAFWVGDPMNCVAF
ncbi:MAG TPA: hypothetical protein VJV78_16415 [Polyangiales bacterium]|nr:hypothetical protein [Polyangiales bacterium]